MVTDVNGCGWVVGRALLLFSLKLPETKQVVISTLV